MRSNLPVSQREHDYPADATLMSVTDTQSRITYANAAFIAVRGFSREELLGQPHNLVRHPDMPAAAFADMWATLQAGRSWTALVKNRRKNGDHYWVRANAAPVVRNGAVTGYMSVRTKPEPAEVAAAEGLYRELREGKARGRRLHQGLLVRTGALAWTAVLQTLPVRWRLRWAAFGLGGAMVAGAALCGLGGGPLAALAATAAVLAAATSWWLESQVSRPLEVVLAQALGVAAGKVEKTKALKRVDEIGMLQRAVSQVGLNLRALVDDVSEQVGGVQTASGEIAQGNTDLSVRTEQAASSLQQTAASMEQMTSNVSNSAESARQAARLAGVASEAAESGGKVVANVVGTMRDITASSKRIADIIGTIDGIAFQTNILALNAAVEAARAGEQGRGFAVVASEVRLLAQRSAAAAKEIKTLIGDSVESIESGARLVDDAGRAMSDIVGQVRSVTDLVNEISHSTTEQSGGIGQVNIAVSQLDQMTQQNAALVEQSAAAAESLKGQASRLVEAIGVYRLG
jgi:aerotaxis receptor